MSNNLKPCPFCKVRNRIVKVHIRSRRLPWWWYIMCDNCHACGETKLFLRRAIKSWNTRADERPKGEWRKDIKYDITDGWYQCSNCNHCIDIATGEEAPLDRGFLFCPNCGADMRKEKTT